MICSKYIIPIKSISLPSSNARKCGIVQGTWIPARHRKGAINLYIQI